MNTPRTDAATGEHSKFHGVEFVSADFARQLETEVQELRAALEAVCELAQMCIENIEDHEQAVIDQARAALAKVPK